MAKNWKNTVRAVFKNSPCIWWPFALSTSKQNGVNDFYDFCSWSLRSIELSNRIASSFRCRDNATPAANNCWKTISIDCPVASHWLLLKVSPKPQTVCHARRVNSEPQVVQRFRGQCEIGWGEWSKSIIQNSYGFHDWWNFALTRPVWTELLARSSGMRNFIHFQLRNGKMARELSHQV